LGEARLGRIGLDEWLRRSQTEDPMGVRIATGALAE
jgi:hypothetical protein